MREREENQSVTFPSGPPVSSRVSGIYCPSTSVILEPRGLIQRTRSLSQLADYHLRYQSLLELGSSRIPVVSAVQT